jgi:hypothetical protein
MDERLKRVRRYYEPIRGVLLHGWDPLGIAEEVHAQDEYDSYVYKILGMLIRHEPRERLVDHLWWIETERMGLTGDPSRVRSHLEKIADRLIAVRDKIEADA